MTHTDQVDLAVGPLFDLVQHGVVLFSLESETILRSNRAADRLLAADGVAASLAGHHFVTLFAERDRPRVAAEVRSYRASGRGSGGEVVTRFEVAALRKMGPELRVEVTLAPLEHGWADQRVLLALFGDLTDRSRLEQEQAHRMKEQTRREASESTERRLAFLVEASTILASSLDYETTLQRLARLVVPHLADYCVIDIREDDGSVRRLASAHRDPRQQHLVTALLDHFPAEEAPHPLREVLRRGEPRLIPVVSKASLRRLATNPGHLEVLRQLGPTSYMVVPLRARNRTLGTITFAVTSSGRRYTRGDLALAEDLARRAALAVDNARLYRESQEALRARDEFVASAAHDLKSPLTAIKGLAQLLRSQATRSGSPEALRLVEGLSRIDATATKMARLLEELLDVTRLEIGQPLELNPEPVDLVALARQVAAEYQQSTQRHRIEVEALAPTLQGMWDVARIERVLGNLLTNAVKYSPRGGDITVRLGREETDQGAWAVLAVQDQGLGIPAADLPHIFERFRRGRNVAGRIAGSGIGLAGSRTIVEQHGGSIQVESCEGVGSTFTVRLPLSPQTPASNERAAGEESNLAERPASRP